MSEVHWIIFVVIIVIIIVIAIVATWCPERNWYVNSKDNLIRGRPICPVCYHAAKDFNIFSRQNGISNTCCTRGHIFHYDTKIVAPGLYYDTDKELQTLARMIFFGVHNDITSKLRESQVVKDKKEQLAYDETILPESDLSIEILQRNCPYCDGKARLRNECSSRCLTCVNGHSWHGKKFGLCAECQYKAWEEEYFNTLLTTEMLESFRQGRLPPKISRIA